MKKTETESGGGDDYSVEKDVEKDVAKEQAKEQTSLGAFVTSQLAEYDAKTRGITEYLAGLEKVASVPGRLKSTRIWRH